MIRLSGRFLKYNLIDKNGVQFSKSATIKIPSKVFVLFNFDKSHPIGIAKVIKDEEGLLAEIESGMDDVLELLEDDKIGCGGYYRAMLTMSAAKVGGVELNRIEDVLKIVEILRVEDVCK